MATADRPHVSNFQMRVCSDVRESEDSVALWLEIRSPELDSTQGEFMDVEYIQGVPCVLLCPKEPGIWLRLEMLEEIVKLARASLDDIKP